MHMQILPCFTKSLCSLFFLLLLSGGLLAQASEDSTNFRRLFLSNNFGMAINPFKPTPTLGLAYAFNPRLHWESGFGYTPSSFWFANEEGETYRGPQVQNRIRHFFRPPQTSRYYIGLEHRWQNIRHFYRETYLRQGQAFQQVALAERRAKAHSLMLQFGLWTNIDNRQRWWLEVYWGLGIRFDHVQTDHPFPFENNETRLPEDNGIGVNLTWREGKSNSIVLPIGIRLNYAIR